MKYLTLSPLLLAAAMTTPHAHAAVQAVYDAIDNEPSTYGTALVCLLLIVLANSRSRSDRFRQRDDE